DAGPAKLHERAHVAIVEARHDGELELYLAPLALDYAQQLDWRVGWAAGRDRQAVEQRRRARAGLEAGGEDHRAVDVAAADLRVPGGGDLAVPAPRSVEEAPEA